MSIADNIRDVADRLEAHGHEPKMIIKHAWTLWDEAKALRDLADQVDRLRAFTIPASELEAPGTLRLTVSRDEPTGGLKFTVSRDQHE